MYPALPVERHNIRDTHKLAFKNFSVHYIPCKFASENILTLIKYIEEQTELFLGQLGIPEILVVYIRLSVLSVFLLLLSVAAFWLAKKILIPYLYKFFKKTSFAWDDLFVETRAFDALPHMVPALFVRLLAPVIFEDFEQLLPLVVRLTEAYLILVTLKVFLSVLKVAEYSLTQAATFVHKPLASYFQLIRIVLYIITFILVLSIIVGKSPVYFLSAFGAMTAILLLIFKDTILGLVASVQMSSNDMVRVGDWVEMPKFNADGSVTDINLHTVKVQNWDKTITTIPTYYFITDSFKNWRGMQQSGGRRIKRALHIDAYSVKLVDPEMRERLKKIQLITEYIETRQREIETFNEENNIDTATLINGRRMTNLGVFRKYIETYLKMHPRIRQDMSMMVRQLANENKGIPLEVYCFTNTIAWVEYEGIQSDIFDHLYSTASYFELAIFQEPGGRDLAAAFGRQNFIPPNS